MGAIFAYIIKSGICLAVFYPFYKFLLSNETFHKSNRIALLAILLLSLVLPIFNFGFSETVAHQNFEIPLEYLLLMQNDVTLPQPEITKITVVHFLLLAYILGAVFFAVRNIFAIIKIYSIIKNGKKQRIENNITLVLHTNNIAPFSWFRYIVICEKDFTENSAAIIEHEKAHIAGNNSFDLLLCAMYNIIQWFNPVAWLLKRELQNIHEYQADEMVINNGIDKKHYKLLLVQKAVGERLFAMANNFNNNKLKKRIKMMSKQKSNPYSRFKYLCILPLLALVVAAFANPKMKNEMNKISAVSINDFMPAGDVNNHNADFTENINTATDTIRIINGNDTTNVITNTEWETYTNNDYQHMYITDYEIVDSIDAVDATKLKKITIIKKDSINGKNLINTIVFKNNDNGDEKSENIIIQSIKNGQPVVVNSGVTLKGKILCLNNAYSKMIIDSTYSALNCDKLNIDSLQNEIKKMNFDSIRTKFGLLYTNDSMKLEGVLNNFPIKISNKKLLNSDSIQHKMSQLGFVSSKSHTISYSYLDSKPLIILDNKEINFDDFEKINKEILFSISVLKGEAATKLYKQKGQNGVIIIETKNNDDKKLDVKSTTAEAALKTFLLNNKPLIIADNKEITSDDLEKINPDDINSMSILKDAASKKLYGEKGSNGVIIIEIKNKE